MKCNGEVREVDRIRIKKFNEAKARGEHFPFVPMTFMSIGTRCMLSCPVQQRIISLLSRGERRLYMDLIFSPDIVSVKEQYPLDYVKTQEIADTERYIHPRDHETGQLRVMTTDFVVERRALDNSIYREALGFKSSLDSEGGQQTKQQVTRIKQKLTIEKLYWKAFGINYRPILGIHLDKVRLDNYFVLSERYQKDIPTKQLIEFTYKFLSAIANFPRNNLRQCLMVTAHSLDVSPRYLYTLFCTAVLRHILQLDLSRPLDFVGEVVLKENFESSLCS
jgi:hypothetical protein